MKNEIPLGSRDPLYRAFEMLPAAVSYSMLLLVVVLPFVSPKLAVWYVLGILTIMLARAVRSAIDLSRGYKRLNASLETNWGERLLELEDPRLSLSRGSTRSGTFRIDQHRANLERLADKIDQLRPSEVLNAVIVAAYNESYEVIAPTIRTLSETRYDTSRMAIFFAYEERGGAEIERTAHRLKEEFGDCFGAFELVQHPRDLPDEIAGKGANITYAGRALEDWAFLNGIDPSKVLVTTLDCDNKPHRDYFNCATYHFIVQPDRKRSSFQPVSLFLNNIWDAPAPTRVIASGNTFWNLTSSVRPLTLRNFASHSQPLDALIEMNFWSTRTIVEDGHQYWRSYFHFGGRYSVVAIPVPIYQDAVIAETYKGSLVAQFKQLSRWSYGASDVPYVAVRVFGRNRQAPFWSGFWRLLSLLEGHITLASLSIIIAVGGWLPLSLALTAHRLRADDVMRDLPIIVGTTQQVAMLGLIVSIVLAWRMLPPRPDRYGPKRNAGMILQWLLFPVTIIGYNAVTALYSQGRLLIGSYRERFDVTVKSATLDSMPTARPDILPTTRPLALPITTGAISLPWLDEDDPR